MSAIIATKIKEIVALIRKKIQNVENHAKRWGSKLFITNKKGLFKKQPLSNKNYKNYRLV